MKQIKFLPLIILIFQAPLLLGQGIHCTRFNFNDYNSGLENWDFCNVGNNIAVANQEGLMLYHNGKWKVNHIQSEISPKSVYCKNNKIYTSFGNRIGYFKTKNNTIIGNFIPITIPPELSNFSNIWEINAIGSTIYFQSEKSIIEIQLDKYIKSHKIKSSIKSIFVIENDLYIIDQNIGLLKNFVPLIGGTILANKEVNVILPFENKDLLIFNNTDQIVLRYNQKEFTAIWDNSLFKNYPFCGSKINNNFIIGTTENGVFVVNEEGKIENHINKENHLKYNKVFSLHYDQNDHLWCGLENGIDRIQFDLPYTNIDFNNLHGNPINIETIDNQTFFLTSTGIYTLPTTHLFHPNSIKNIQNWNNTKGPSYFLKQINNHLIYSNIFGLFSYKNGVTKLLIESKNCTEFNLINQKYFIVKSNEQWLLFSTENELIQFEKALNLPKNFQLIEGKIIWSFTNEIFQQNYNSDIEFSNTKSFKMKENIDRLFIKNDTVFMTNSQGTFFLMSNENNNIKTLKYNQNLIYDLDNQKTVIEQIPLKRTVYYDSNFPNPHQISNFISSVVSTNNDKLSFIKQLNDSLFCLGTYKGFTIINSRKINSKNEIDYSINLISLLSNDKIVSYKSIKDKSFFSPLNRISIHLIVSKDLTPQIPLFRLNIIKDNETITTPWQKEYTLIYNDLEIGSYNISVECKDWFGNIKKIELGDFNVSKEQKIMIILKTALLIIILSFLLSAFFKMYKKRK